MFDLLKPVFVYCHFVSILSCIWPGFRLQRGNKHKRPTQAQCHASFVLSKDSKELLRLRMLLVTVLFAKTRLEAWCWFSWKLLGGLSMDHFTAVDLVALALNEVRLKLTLF